MWRASRKRQRNPCSEVARRFALRTLVQLCMVLSFNRGQPNPVHFRSPRLGLGQRRHLAAGERLALQGLLLRRACRSVLLPGWLSPAFACGTCNFSCPGGQKIQSTRLGCVVAESLVFHGEHL